MIEKSFKEFSNKCFNEFKFNELLIDTSDGNSLCYADGFELIKLAAAKLQMHGILRGDMVLTYTPLSIESVVLCWACIYTGVVFVPVDHNWSNEMVQRIVDETSPKLILTDHDRFNVFDPKNKTTKLIIAGSKKVNHYTPLFFEWIKKSEVNNEFIHDEVLPSDLAVILYTSGSTGIPKGVMLSQQALLNSGKLAATHFEWSSSDIFLNLGDLHSMSGLRNTCLAPLFAGSSFVVATTTERNNVLHIFELIQKHGIQFVGVAPTIVRQMNIMYSEVRKNQLSSIKAILCSGGALASDQLELFYQHYNKPVLNYYGLTETAGLCAGHNFESFNALDNSIGKAVGAELTIEPDSSFSSENGVGELVVKSNNLMSGYYKRDEETNEVLRNGCFYTGDIVRKRADDCFELLGRKRNIVKSLHSELIYLEEIDAAIESHQLVLEASTCSHSQNIEDERIIAFIVLKNTRNVKYQDIAKEIKQYLIEKVGRNRMPWCYYFEEKLPRNTAGKVQRQLLKEKLNEYNETHAKRYF